MRIYFALVMGLSLYSEESEGKNRISFLQFAVIRVILYVPIPFLRGYN